MNSLQLNDRTDSSLIVKKFNLKMLPTRVITRIRKPTAKLNSDEESVKLNRRILKPKFFTEQVDQEIINTNLLRLKQKSVSPSPSVVLLNKNKSTASITKTTTEAMLTTSNIYAMKRRSANEMIKNTRRRQKTGNQDSSIKPKREQSTDDSSESTVDSPKSKRARVM